MTLDTQSGAAVTPQFEHLVRTHQAGVWRYLRILGCGPDLADDLTQETFLRVLGVAFDRLGDVPPRAYLRRVAKNAWLRHLERDARRTEIALDDAELAFAWLDADGDAGDAKLRALDDCLAALSARVRRALELRFVERLGRDAIAAQLGISGLAVKSLLARAYAQLRTCIERRTRDGTN